MTLPQRFWTKVEKTETCWLWVGARSTAGYGVLRDTVTDGGRLRYAHRLSFQESAGPIPEGLTIDHLCRVRACVNPAHLEAVTLAENIRRAYSWMTHCHAGHPYNSQNTYTRANGRRQCRACRRGTSGKRLAAAA